MAGDDTIVVTEEARELMRDLETNDPGAPSSSAIRQVTGAHLSTGGSEYRNAMQQFASLSHDKFRGLLEDVRKDCATAVKALEDLNSQDQEIMAMLRNLDQETEAAAEASRAATTGGCGGHTATAW